MHRWSLKFVEDGMEKDFVQSREASVLSSLYLCSTLVFLFAISTCSVAYISNLYNYSTVHIPVYASLVALMAVAALSASIMICFRFTKLSVHLGPDKMEILCCILALVGTFACCCAESFYMAKILGYDPWATWPDTDTEGESSRFSDSRVLLSISSAMTLSLSLMHVRWHIISAVPLSGVMTYMIPMLSLGSPEAHGGPVLNCVMLAFVAIGLSLGKRRLEWFERFQFATVIEESKFRCKSEFQLQCMPVEAHISPSHDSDRHEASGSFATSSSKARIFESAEGGEVSALSSIASLGRKEHWLIHSDQLMLLPNSVLGHGGFGVVVAGTFEGMPVAVKAPREAEDARGLTRRFANELRILRQLRHPSLVMFHGACVSAQHDDIALVFEYVEGPNLVSFIGRPTCPEEMHPLAHRHQLAEGISCALRYLHSQRPIVVHGDLKASNVIVEAGPRAKLLDYCMSRRVTPRAKLTGDSLHWVAPEVIMQTYKFPRAAADVFSFGRLLDFIVAGIQPTINLRKPAILKLAKANHLSLSGQRFQDPLASCSLPTVELCLNANPARRPSMRHIFEVVSSWPNELNFAPMTKKFDGAMDTDDPGDPLSRELHIQLERARRLVSMDSKRAELNKAKQTELNRDALGPRSVQGCKPSEDSQRNREKPRQQLSHSLPAVQEDTTTISVRTGVATPRMMQYVTIMDAVHRWNFQVHESPCCWYHSGMKEALDVIKELNLKPCRLDCPFRQDMEQCPSCHLFDSKPPKGVLFECFLCGFVSSSYKPGEAGVTSSLTRSSTDRHDSAGGNVRLESMPPFKDYL